MRMRMAAVLAAVATVVAVAGAAGADPLPGKQAQRMLYSPSAGQPVIVAGSGLSDADQKIVKALFTIDQFKALNVSYYAAMAVSPGDGLQSAASNLAQNLHSPAAADAQALAACNRTKKAKTPCVVVARVLPKRWTPQGLTLNRDATEGVKAYRRDKGPKALAISASTPVWSMAQGFGAGTAALRECKRQAAAFEVDDCAVVIADK